MSSWRRVCRQHLGECALRNNETASVVLFEYKTTVCTMPGNVNDTKLFVKKCSTEVVHRGCVAFGQSDVVALFAPTDRLRYCAIFFTEPKRARAAWVGENDENRRLRGHSLSPAPVYS